MSHFKWFRVRKGELGFYQRHCLSLRLFLFCLSLALVCLQGFSARAETCAEVYREKSARNGKLTKLKLLGVLSNPVGWEVGGLLLVLDHHYTRSNFLTASKNRKKVADLFDAATLLNRHLEDADLDRNTDEWRLADQIVGDFYEKYVSKPNPVAAPLERVINRLAFVNRNGVELGICHGLPSKWYLAQVFFDRGTLSIDKILKYIETARAKEDQERAKLSAGDDDSMGSSDDRPLL